MPSTLTKTSTLLLAGLQDPKNQEVWVEFDTRYRPVLFGVARRLGLSVADAEDVVQQTLVEFSRDFLDGRYDRHRGRLRTWIFGILRHRIIDLQRADARRPEHTSGTALLRIPDESSFTRAWDIERAAAILKLALDSLRSGGQFSIQTLDVFEMFGLRGTPARSVAAEYAMNVDDVYAAKYRVGEALKKMVSTIELAYDE
jgi:RNA polymerase sigma factor (sigma-70 family)